ncbi:nSTAND1 domain-containing NTPase [Actinophytocola xanthii]|uniref:Novel STAND NTPase 1 domain-containing protein n=1 Tax=Actinophytocola xanthii TaxID=1912961 RepID=A0A1Q8CL09_9PSEU|nr:ATP-binding protein [Actinophytocola xanthii]OLF15045.1 hypothetical protein BU204_23485 [Actinophytocola xanthii]
MTVDSQCQTNPFPGPQAYGRNERDWFFGRTNEIEDLTSLVLSTSTTLLYAPSGTGKSSLVQAGVAPHLEQRFDFRVLPAVHLGTGARTDGGGNVANPFIRAVRDAISGGSGDPGDLNDVVERCRPADTAGRVLLVLDQFEEVFADPELWVEREEFFATLSSTLDRHTWLRAIIALRSDYLAELAPYERLLPDDGLTVRYQLEPLSEEAATEAVRAAFTATGLTLASGDLRTLMDMLLVDPVRPHVRARYVNTIQLQIVCRQLWEEVRQQEGPVQAVLASGSAVSLTDSMVRFVDDAIAAAVGHNHRAEAAVRWWLSHRLITSSGRRAFVQVGEEDSAGLPNALLTGLAEVKLVQLEQRHGSRLVELTHDSMTDGVRASNEAWLRVRAQIRRRVSALLFVILLGLLGAFPFLLITEEGRLAETSGALGETETRVSFQGGEQAVVVDIWVSALPQTRAQSLTLRVVPRGGSADVLAEDTVELVPGTAVGSLVGARTRSDRWYEVVLRAERPDDEVSYQLSVSDLPLMPEGAERVSEVSDGRLGVVLAEHERHLVSVHGGDLVGVSGGNVLVYVDELAVVEGTRDDQITVLQLEDLTSTDPPASATVLRERLPGPRPMNQDEVIPLSFSRAQVVSFTVPDSPTPLGLQGRCSPSAHVAVSRNDTQEDAAVESQFGPEPSIVPLRLQPGEYSIVLASAADHLGGVACTLSVRSFSGDALSTFGVYRVGLHADVATSAVAVRLAEDAVLTAELPAELSASLLCDRQADEVMTTVNGRLLAYVAGNARCTFWFSHTQAPEGRSTLDLSVVRTPGQGG